MNNKSSLPLWLNAEITYKCPLHCVFCYNPLNYAKHDNELDTESWIRVFSEARKLGSVQLGLSGGEPMLRKDIEILVEESCKLGFFTNLITSGIGLTEENIDNFKKNPNKINYIYILTPKGIAYKTALTLKFIEKKMKEYDELRNELKNN